MHKVLRIDEILTAKGLSLANLAKGIGCSRENLYTSLNTNPTLERLEKIAKFLGVDISDLFHPTGHLVNGIIDFNRKIYRISSVNDLVDTNNKIKKALKDQEYQPGKYDFNHIIYLLNEKGDDLGQMAKYINTTKQNLYRSLSANPTLQTLIKIADYLNVNLSDLFKQTLNDNSINGLVKFGNVVFNISSSDELNQVAKKIQKQVKSNEVIVTQDQLDNLLDNLTDKYTPPTPRIIKPDDIIFDQIETYDATNENCWDFRTKGDEREGIILDLSNMVSGFPFTMLNQPFNDSECAYIAGCYSHPGDQYHTIQNELSTYSKGGYTAKGMYRKTENETTALIRKDWEMFNFEWMLLAIWSKCQTNTDFKNLLLSIPPDAQIIENTSHQYGRTSNIWGAKNPELKKARGKKSNQIEKRLVSMGVADKKIIERYQMLIQYRTNHVGVWTGKNVTGKCLKLCQLALINNTAPPIDYHLLNSKNIYWFGEKLEFKP